MTRPSPILNHTILAPLLVLLCLISILFITNRPLQQEERRCFVTTAFIVFKSEGRLFVSSGIEDMEEHPRSTLSKTVKAWLAADPNLHRFVVKAPENEPYDSIDDVLVQLKQAGVEEIVFRKGPSTP